MRCKECGATQGSPKWDQQGDRHRFFSLRYVYEAYMGDHSENHIEDAGVFCSVACLVAYLGSEGRG